MLINLSNHPSDKWSEKQLIAAKEMYGDITDYAFPAVNASDSTEQIYTLADETAAGIIAMSPDAVLCQGEFSLTYALVERFKAKGITVICACSERNTREVVTPDGKTEKTVTFDFVRFREY